MRISSSTVAVEDPSIFFESVNYVHGCDGGCLSMFCVCECVTNDSVQEVVNVIADVGVCCVGDAFDSTSACKPSYGSIGDDGSERFSI